MIHRNERCFGAAEGAGEVNVLTLSSTFSLSTLKPQLEAWLQVIRAPHRIEIAPGSLPHSYLLDPEHGLTRHSNGIHVVLFRLDDWNNFADGSYHGDEIHPESRKLVERNLQLTIDSLEAAARRSFGSLVLVLCPISPEHNRRQGVRRYFETVETRLNEALACCSRYTLLNAAALMPEAEAQIAGGEHSAPSYTLRFFQLLSRRIGQMCYAAESRPWKALVLSPRDNAGPHSPAWQDFIGAQWQCGRRLAMISDHPSSTPDAPDERYVATDFSSLPVPQKIRLLAQELLISDQDLIFLGKASECREIEAFIPQVLALPVFDRESDWASIIRELWCLQPIPEVWLSELDSPKPSLPRLGGPLLIRIAEHPDWPASAFLPQAPGPQAPE